MFSASAAQINNIRVLEMRKDTHTHTKNPNKIGREKTLFGARGRRGHQGKVLGTRRLKRQFKKNQTNKVLKKVWRKK